jgi:DNA-binding HxlR family transcriptional regulator
VRCAHYLFVGLQQPSRLFYLNSVHLEQTDAGPRPLSAKTLWYQLTRMEELSFVQRTVHPRESLQ